MPDSQYCLDPYTGMTSCLLPDNFLWPRWERVPEQPDLWRSIVPQHLGELPLPLPHWLQLRADRRRMRGHQRVLHQPEPLQVRLFKHRRGLPLWVSTWILPCRARVREWLAVGKPGCRCFQMTDGFVCIPGTVSQVWAFPVVALLLVKEMRWMIILCLLRPAMNVRSTAIPRRAASAAAPTQHRMILQKTCR